MSRKRIDVVKVQMVKEDTLWYLKRRIEEPKDAADIMRDFIGNADREHFILICLNSKNEPTHIETVSIGTINFAVIHPREIFKTAILSNATGMIMIHIGMKNQWRNYNLLYPQCYINFAFFLMAKLSLKVGWR